MAIVAPDKLPEFVTHELVNRHGDRVRLLNYGARVCSLTLQLADGPRNVVLGYGDPRDYLADDAFLGATIGRYSNRIGNASFSIDGRHYRLSAGDGKHQLHGGPGGFHRRFWNVGGGASASNVEFCLESPDGDQGFPGSLRACVRYAWTDDRILLVTFAATADKMTHVNMTNHSYFNLDGKGQVHDHFIRIAADAVTAVDSELIPNGTLEPVSGTDLDLASPVRIGRLFDSEHPLLRAGGGPDLNYVLGDSEPAATLIGSRQDLKLDVWTTCPGLQFYAGQNLGPSFGACAGACLETQYFPDSPNQPGFPRTLLLPGQLYNETTRFALTEV